MTLSLSLKDLVDYTNWQRGKWFEYLASRVIRC